MEHAKAFYTHEEMQKLFAGGPQVAKATLALVAGRIYKHEEGGWRLLDNQPHSRTEELSDGSA